MVDNPFYPEDHPFYLEDHPFYPEDHPFYPEDLTLYPEDHPFYLGYKETKKARFFKHMIYLQIQYIQS